LQAGSDVDAAVWVESSELGPYGLAEKTIAVIARACELAQKASGPTR
jgi:hypothetical protein